MHYFLLKEVRILVQKRRKFDFRKCKEINCYSKNRKYGMVKCFFLIKHSKINEQDLKENVNK